MEPEPQGPAARPAAPDNSHGSSAGLPALARRTPEISDVERQRVADLLRDACGEGLLTLEEFSVRVGAAWAADTSEELAQATEGLAIPARPSPVSSVPVPLSGNEPVEKVVNVFGENKRRGRWRLPRALHVVNVFGSCELDLRDAAVGSDAMAAEVVTISGRNVFGEVKVIVPEGVEVELLGSSVFGSRSLHVAPVGRLAGTPIIQVRVNTYFGEVTVRSQGPDQGSGLARWVRDHLSS